MTDFRYIQFAGVDAPPRIVRSSRGAPAGRTSRAGFSPGVDSRGRDVAAGLHPFLQWLLCQASIDPTKYRTQAVNRRLPACLRVLRAPTPEAAKEIILGRPGLIVTAVSTLLIGVTEFFREREVFDAMRSLVLPALPESASAIRILSAGVSRGHELYSMAMLMAEAGALPRCELVGVDCRSDAIAAAAGGRFDAEEMAALDEDWRKRYFTRQGDLFLAARELRQRMRWQVADLSSFTAGPLFHVVLFRNVVIYFENPGALNIWERICARIADGGFLITGRAERPPPQLPLTRIASCIYLKTPP